MHLSTRRDLKRMIFQGHACADTEGASERAFRSDVIK